jgi:hypothetical protein
MISVTLYRFCLPFVLRFQLPTSLFELLRDKTTQQVDKADNSALSEAKSRLKRESSALSWVCNSSRRFIPLYQRGFTRDAFCSETKIPLSGESACPAKSLPNEMQSIFHRGVAYFTGGASQLGGQARQRLTSLDFRNYGKIINTQLFCQADYFTDI